MDDQVATLTVNRRDSYKLKGIEHVGIYDQ